MRGGGEMGAGLAARGWLLGSEVKGTAAGTAGMGRVLVAGGGIEDGSMERERERE